jgi:hypothetical protein
VTAVRLGSEFREGNAAPAAGNLEFLQVCVSPRRFVETKKAFRLVVMRGVREQDLFEDHAAYRYHAIASNRPDEDARAFSDQIALYPAAAK